MPRIEGCSSSSGGFDTCEDATDDRLPSLRDRAEDSGRSNMSPFEDSSRSSAELDACEDAIDDRCEPPFKYADGSW